MSKYSITATKQDYANTFKVIKTLEIQVGARLDWKKIKRANLDELATIVAILKKKLPFEILSYKEGNHIIQVGTVGWNNGKPNQSYNLQINANINAVKRKSDGLIIFADGSKRYKTKNFRSFYITHLWYNEGLNVIRCAGYYTKEQMKNEEYFSCSICDIGDVINDQPIGAEATIKALKEIYVGNKFLEKPDYLEGAYKQKHWKKNKV